MANYFLVGVTILLGFIFGLLDASSVEQVSVSFGNSPTEIVAMWAVFNGSLTDGIVQYGDSEAALTWTATATAKTYKIGSYNSPTIYTAVLKDLKPGNVPYWYRVGSPSAGYSSAYSFKTHPGVGTEGVTFYIVGDPGQTSNTVQTFNELLDTYHNLHSHDLSGGLVSMGDLSYANGNQPLWDSFGNLKQSLVTEIPMFSTVGNHEWFDESDSAFTSYINRFWNPSVKGKKELYYSFDAGLVHWIMVSGYCPEMKVVTSQPCLAPGTDQMNWFLNELKTVDKKVTPWVFVVFHQPYVNSNLKHSMPTEGFPMQQAVEDAIYNSQVVDVVFSGHVHAYERSCRVYKYKCVDDAPYYITIGDGGNAEGLASTWLNPQPEWSLFRQASYGFGDVLVANSTHAKWTWRQNQDLEPLIGDEFWFVRSGGLMSSKLANTGVTKEPVFTQGARGETAAKINLQRVLLSKE